MTSLETRYPCPVCLAIKMEKVRLPAGPSELILDHCTRCGGVWFDAGEVQLLRRTDAERLWRAIVRREDVHTMRCHSCHAMLARTEPSCAACGWKVELDCPVCERPMRRSEQSGMRLDHCARDKGVWFDHDELTGIWKLEASALVRQRRSGELADGGDNLLLDSLLMDPFVLYYGVHGAALGAGAAAEALASTGAAEAMGGVVGAAGDVAGAAGEVASSLFEAIVEIIGGIFG